MGLAAARPPVLPAYYFVPYTILAQELKNLVVMMSLT